MTSYEKGFLTKCAEYGINGSYILARKANAGAPTGATVGTNDYLSSIIGGSVLGGLAGGLFSKEDRLKNAILGALLGGAAGGGIHYGVDRYNNSLSSLRDRHINDAVSQIYAENDRLKKSTDAAIMKRRDDLTRVSNEELAAETAKRNATISRSNREYAVAKEKNREAIEKAVEASKRYGYDLLSPYNEEEFSKNYPR